MSVFVKEPGDVMKEVMITTFPEFGWSPAQVMRSCTNHGTAMTFSFFRSSYEKSSLATQGIFPSFDLGALIHLLDFRSGYAALLTKWLEVPSEKILNSSFLC